MQKGRPKRIKTVFHYSLSSKEKTSMIKNAAYAARGLQREGYEMTIVLNSGDPNVKELAKESLNRKLHNLGYEGVSNIEFWEFDVFTKTIYQKTKGLGKDDQFVGVIIGHGAGMVFGNETSLF
jgi:hypothetical protein